MLHDILVVKYLVLGYFHVYLLQEGVAWGYFENFVKYFLVKILLYSVLRTVMSPLRTLFEFWKMANSDYVTACKYLFGGM